VLRGWGRLPGQAVAVTAPGPDDDLASTLAGTPGAIVPRGAGCSYGDAALAAGDGRGATVLDTTRRTRVLDVDVDRGVVVVQSGLTLAALMALVVPLGWTVPVLPGTTRVTVGGAVASDVHGKNQPGAGTFGDHVRWLTLVRSDGTVERLVPDERPDAFWATVGGLGLTGVVDTVCLQLQRLASPWMSSTRFRTDDLSATLAAMDDVAARQVGDPGLHVVGWLDGTSKQHAGRGLVEVSRHLDQPGTDEPPRAVVPAGLGPQRWQRSLPGSGAVNGPSIAAANLARWTSAARRVERTGSIEQILFPLDRAGGSWPAAFGSSGLVQYQLVLPPMAASVLSDVLDLLRVRGCPPALAVLKRFTSESRAMLGFVLPGWSLALDFPARWPALPGVLAELDGLVAGAGGRLYLTKDSRLAAPMLAATTPRLQQWRRERDLLDPAQRMVTGLGRRTGLVVVRPTPTAPHPGDRVTARPSRPGSGTAGAPRVALVVGGSSDIGLAVTEAVLAGSPGSSVVLAGRESSRRAAVAQRLGLRHRAVELDWDALAREDPDQVLDDVTRLAGGVPDLAVIAVGTLPRGGPDPSSVDAPRDLRDALEVNLVAPAALLPVLVRRMGAAGGGRIVVLSSAAAVRPRAELRTYAVAKQALDALALDLVEPAARLGVGVHVVRPGHVRTAMTRGLAVAPLSRTAEQVARDVVAGLDAEQTVIWSPAAMRVVMAGLRTVPPSLLPRSLR
jgi:decaprenylphospho-beta-D-ribofuranose 2-oxidase